MSLNEFALYVLIRRRFFLSVSSAQRQHGQSAVRLRETLMKKWAKTVAALFLTGQLLRKMCSSLLSRNLGAIGSVYR